MNDTRTLSIASMILSAIAIIAVSYATHQASILQAQLNEANETVQSQVADIKRLKQVSDSNFETTEVLLKSVEHLMDR